MSHCIECSLVYDVHIIIVRVPEVTETRVAIGIVVDNVHTGNLEQVVHVYMVIRYFGAFLLGEEAAETEFVRGVPYLLTCLLAVRLENLS